MIAGAGGFHCKTCEEIARLMLHALHSDPQFQVGQRHAGCRELKTIMRQINKKVLDHARRCPKEKKYLRRLAQCGNVLPFSSR